MKIVLKLTLLAALVGLAAWVLKTRRPRAEAISPAVHSAHAEELAPLEAPSAARPSSEPTRTVPESEDPHSPAQTTALAPARSILEATVVDPLGQPLSGIRLVSLETPERTSEASGADGSLRFEYVWPHATRRQRLELQLRGESCAWHHLSVDDGPDLRSDEPVFLGRIVLHPGGALRGRVVDPRGMALGGVQVYATAPLEEFSEDELSRLRALGRMRWPGFGTSVIPRAKTQVDRISSRT